MRIRSVFPVGLTMLLILSAPASAPLSAGPRAVAMSQPATASLSGLVTVVSSDSAPGGSFGVERVLCPDGMVAVGGGIDMDNVLTMDVSSSAPAFEGADARLISRPDGTNPAPIGWQATARNDAASPQSFKVAAICAPLSGVSTVVSSDSASGGSFGVERVLCPDGTVAVGGGIDMDNVLTMDVSSSAPAFEGADARLISRPDGTNPAPIGWQASARNDAASTQSFKVAAICAEPVFRVFLPLVMK